MNNLLNKTPWFLLRMQAKAGTAVISKEKGTTPFWIYECYTDSYDVTGLGCCQSAIEHYKSRLVYNDLAHKCLLLCTDTPGEAVFEIWI